MKTSRKSAGRRRVSLRRNEPAGYVECGCRDCFEIGIGRPGDLCHECDESGCDAESECLSPGAYGGDDVEPNASYSYATLKKEARLWAKSFAVGLMHAIRPRPTSIAAVSPDMILPAGWDYKVYARFDITLASGETLSAAAGVSVSDYESSGSVTLDQRYGGTIATARADTRDEVTRSLVSQVGSHLSRDLRSNGMVNSQGLTFEEWYAAAGSPTRAEGGSSASDLQAAWENGEDPSDYRVASRRQAYLLHNPPIEFDAETRALAQRVYGTKKPLTNRR